MAIKKYYPTADTTITDAYRENLTDRGDGANMGLADTLETFVIFDQVETTVISGNNSTIVPEREKARILIKFDAATILGETDVANDSYFLRLSNAVHGQTLPENYSLDVYALDTSFSEGHGKDADEYSYSGTIGQDAAASWNTAAYDSAPPATPATGTFHVDVLMTEDFTIEIGHHSVVVVEPGGGWADTDAVAADIVTAINTDSNINALVSAAPRGGEPSEIIVTANDIGGNVITLAITIDPAEAGSVYVNLPAVWAGPGNPGTNGVNHLFGGVDTIPWTTPGGDFNTVTSPLLGSQAFVDGDEDLLLDVSGFFQSVDAGTYPDNGLIIKMGVAEEALLRTFYTKKFFARSSEHFFLRPCIEVRQDDSTQDDRGKFYAVHPMRSANNNTLTLQNYEGGVLVNALLEPDSLSIWVDSTKNVLLQTEGVTGGSDSVPTTGIYTTAAFSLDTPLEEVYLEWIDLTGPTICHTETLSVKQRSVKATANTHSISFLRIDP